MSALSKLRANSARAASLVKPRSTPPVPKAPKAPKAPKVPLFVRQAAQDAQSGKVAALLAILASLMGYRGAAPAGRATHYSSLYVHPAPKLSTARYASNRGAVKDADVEAAAQVFGILAEVCTPHVVDEDEFSIMEWYETLVKLGKGRKMAETRALVDLFRTHRLARKPQAWQLAYLNIPGDNPDGEDRWSGENIEADGFYTRSADKQHHRGNGHYGKDGFNVDGFNRSGYDRNGYDSDGELAFLPY